MIHQQRLPRLYLRLGCFVLAILLLWPLPFWLNHSRILVQASPFVTICVILAGGTFQMGFILGLGFFLIALARKRWFCRHICPVGLLLDGVAGIGLQKKSWWARCPSIGRSPLRCVLPDGLDDPAVDGSVGTFQQCLFCLQCNESPLRCVLPDGLDDPAVDGSHIG